VVKVAEEATAKVTTEEVTAATVATEEAVPKMEDEEAAVAMVAAEATAVVGPDGSSGGGPNVA
jgi:hypothetical protein